MSFTAYLIVLAIATPIGIVLRTVMLKKEADRPDAPLPASMRSLDQNQER